MDQPVQEGSCRQDDAAGVESDPGLCDDPDHPVALDQQIVDRLLKQAQIRLALQAASDRLAVQHPVGLGARCLHRRALGRIQYPELDSGFVSCNGHHAVQCVDFLHQVTLADPADRRVARHLAECFKAVGDQQRRGSQPCRRQARFSARVAAADDDYVEIALKSHLENSAP